MTKKLVATNPATGEEIASYDTLDNAGVAAAIDRADTAFHAWKNVSYGDRAEYFMRLAEELDARAEYYGAIITAEMGKPITQSIAEVKKCAWNCRYFAQNAEQMLAPDVIETEARESYVQFDPLGIILFVMPWNYPFWQAIRQAAPTMMVGNTVLLKHASNVPGCALAIQEAFERAGFPQDAFQSLLMTSSHTEQVLEDFRVKGVSLTGSVGAGSAVASLAGKHNKRQVMELGGSDPFIVLADADVDEAAKVAATARLQSAGQSCIAAKRFIVVDEVYDAFVAKHVKAIESMAYGDPTKEETAIGPVSSPAAADELAGQIADSIAKGARLLSGDGKAGGAWIAPVVLADVAPGMVTYEQEVFGPVSSIIRAKDEADAVRIANDTIYGLGGSLWTTDIAKAKEIATQINSGAVFINTMTKSDPRMPFGGVNKGGYGRELSSYGLKEFANIKTVWIEN